MRPGMPHARNEARQPNALPTDPATAYPRGTHGDRQVEERQNLGSRFDGEEIAQQRRSNRGIGCLADSHGGPREQESGEVGREGSSHGRATPHEHSGADEQSAPHVALVGQVSEDWRGEHVDDEESRHGQRRLHVAEAQIALDEPLARAGHEAIAVVQQVQQAA